MKYQGKITDPKDLVTKEYVDTGLSGKLGTSGDGSNVTAAFTAASSRTNISTGEKLTVIFGKIAKWFADLGAAAFRGVDSVPTDNSTNLVESGGVKSALDTFVRPNLLDNWYFVGGGSQHGGGQCPINQREQTSYTGAVNGIDRWKGTNNNTVAELNSNFLSLSSASQTANVYLQQEFSAAPGSFLGQTITVSALLDSGLYFKTGVVPSSVHASGNYRVVTMDDIPNGRDFGVFLRAANSAANAGKLYYQIGLNHGGSSHHVVAVKVELGDTQTLAHNEGTEANPVWVPNEIPDYGIEKLKCQRYLFIPTNEINVRCTTYTANGLYFDMPCPVELAGNPTIETGLVIRSLDYTAQTGFTFTSTKRGNMNYLRVIAAKNGHGMTDGILSITAWTPISCEP